MTRFVIPFRVVFQEYRRSVIIPRDDSLGVCSAVIAGEYFPHVRVSIFLRKAGTVYSGRVTAAFRVHEEFRIRDVPGNGTEWFRHKFLERQPRVVDSDLMATERSTGATCNRKLSLNVWQIGFKRTRLPSLFVFIIF